LQILATFAARRSTSNQMRGYKSDTVTLRRQRHFTDIATVPYPIGVPIWIDDETTVPIDTREMRFTAEAAMYIDPALVSR
jgi:hypothetical protein